MTLAARKAFDEALTLEQSGDLDRALVSYLKAQELAPNDTEIAYRAASALLQSGYAEEAQSQLRRIVFSEPDHLRARASLGNCQLLLGDLQNAKQNFQDVLSQAPDNRNALYGLASVHLKENNAAAAMEPAKRLIELLPDTPSVLTLFAQIEARSGQPAAAIAAYRKAIKVDGRYLPALLGLAETLLLRKRYDEVIELTVRACELSPADSHPLVMLSDALAGKGALADAQEAAEAALKTSPGSQAALLRLSILSRKLGDHTDALKFALKAHDRDRSAQEPLNALGAALAAMKHSKEARAVLTCLSSGQPLDPSIRLLVENLVSTRAETGTEETKEVKPSESEAQVVDLPDVQVSGARATKDNGSAIENLSDETGKPDSKPLQKPAFLNADEDPLPNVLGLRRRDNT